MDLPILLAAIVLVVLVAAMLLWQRSRGTRATPAVSRALDTVLSWSPETVRIMTMHERQAYSVLTRALPDHMVLAQVSLSRFLKVPRRYSYAEWLSRVGYLSADLLVCDRSSQVLAVVEIHSPRDSERSRQRHARMARVLKAAGVRCIVWMEGAIPGPDAAREQLLPQLPAAKESEELAEGPMPGMAIMRPGLATIPVPDAEELDVETTQPMREPAPSTWFDDLDAATGPLTPDEKKR